MAETAVSRRECEGQALEQLRLLTEVNHLRTHLAADGRVPEAVLDDVKTNIFTAVQEMAIPSAVTTTIQRVETEYDERGRSRRVIKWLGKSAIDVAESGYVFHADPAAHRRVDVEVAEAHYSQQNLRYGTAQVFISPKMTDVDAPAHIAKAEHLHGEDAVRVSRAIVDNRGEIVARRMESLLVSDIPMSAWTVMLQDPDNIFGKSIVLSDTASALSVMEAFRELEISEQTLPQGPVSILKAVNQYLPQESDRQKLREKITRYENDQELYAAKAEAAAGEWLQFDLELARSLQAGTANLDVQRFITIFQHDWDASERSVIQSHDVAGEYVMTTELAALLEKKQRHVLASRVALATGNSSVMAQTDARTAERLRQNITELEAMRGVLSASELAMREASLMRELSRQNFKVGGGCAGSVGGKKSGENGSQGDELDDDMENATDNDEGSGSWTWKKGVCRVKTCPSPKPTEVGPCSVCRHCQRKFDQGQDPTAADASETGTGSDLSGENQKIDYLEFMKKLFETKSSPSPVTV